VAPLLEVEDIRTFYGSIEALKGVSLTVEEGEVVTLIGANGAGKSTTLRSISGLTSPRFGSIRFEGREISNMPAQEIVRLGISQSPEGRRTFQRMTVRENRASRSASARRRGRCPEGSSRCSRWGGP
jgi:branched-chain amino acid transport system ATP-binding protein